MNWLVDTHSRGVMCFRVITFCANNFDILGLGIMESGVQDLSNDWILDDWILPYVLPGCYFLCSSS